MRIELVEINKEENIMSVHFYSKSFIIIINWNAIQQQNESVNESKPNLIK